jgi:hypothetical protein
MYSSSNREIPRGPILIAGRVTSNPEVNLPIANNLGVTFALRQERDDLPSCARYGRDLPCILTLATSSGSALRILLGVPQGIYRRPIQDVTVCSKPRSMAWTVPRLLRGIPRN